MQLLQAKIRTIFVGEISGAVLPSVGELGRFHFSKKEQAAQDRIERIKEMAFKTIDVSLVPKSNFGHKATEPRISFTEAGRFSFNKLIIDAWQGMGKLLIQYDEDNRLLGFRAFPKEVKLKNIEEKVFLPLVPGRTRVKGAPEGAKEDKWFEPDGTLSASGIQVLSEIKYDWRTARNQNFPAKYDEKSKMYIVAVPRETPTAKPKIPRRPKAAMSAASVGSHGTNGAPAAAPASQVEAPAEAELMEL